MTNLSLRVGRTMQKFPRSTPCTILHPQGGYRDLARLLGEDYLVNRDYQIVVNGRGCGCIGTVDSRRNLAQS